MEAEVVVSGKVFSICVIVVVVESVVVGVGVVVVGVMVVGVVVVGIVLMGVSCVAEAADVVVMVAVVVGGVTVLAAAGVVAVASVVVTIGVVVVMMVVVVGECVVVVMVVVVGECIVVVMVVVMVGTVLALVVVTALLVFSGCDGLMVRDVLSLLSSESATGVLLCGVVSVGRRAGGGECLTGGAEVVPMPLLLGTWSLVLPRLPDLDEDKAPSLSSSRLSSVPEDMVGSS